MEGNNIDDWEALFQEEFENIDRKNQFIERGKLEGRPKLNEPKKERLALRFTVQEMKLLKERADKKKLSLTEYSRIILLEKNYRTMKKT